MIPKVQVRILRLVDFLFVFEILVGKVEAFFFNPRGLSMFHADVSKTYSHIDTNYVFITVNWNNTCTS